MWGWRKLGGQEVISVVYCQGKVLRFVIENGDVVLWLSATHHSSEATSPTYPFYTKILVVTFKKVWIMR